MSEAITRMDTTFCSLYIALKQEIKHPRFLSYTNPDRAFRYFTASKSVHRRFLCSSETPLDELGSCKFVLCLVWTRISNSKSSNFRIIISPLEAIKRTFAAGRRRRTQSMLRGRGEKNLLRVHGNGQSKQVETLRTQLLIHRS